jgi:hypothetical protein
LVTRSQPAGGGAKDRHTQPVAASVSDSVEKLLANGADVAQIMMFGELATGTPFGLGSREQLDLNSSQRDGSTGLTGTRLIIHGRSMKNRKRKVQRNALTHLSPITYRSKRIFRGVLPGTASKIGVLILELATFNLQLVRRGT